jgi:hypothetical protein
VAEAIGREVELIICRDSDSLASAPFLLSLLKILLQCPNSESNYCFCHDAVTMSVYNDSKYLKAVPCILKICGIAFKISGAEKQGA